MFEENKGKPLEEERIKKMEQVYSDAKMKNMTEKELLLEILKELKKQTSLLEEMQKGLEQTGALSSQKPRT